MRISFNNQVAVITGAAGGIGQALAVAMAREGARLALSDIDMEGLARTEELLPTGWPRDIAIFCNMRRRSSPTPRRYNRTSAARTCCSTMPAARCWPHSTTRPWTRHAGLSTWTCGA